MRIIGIDIDPWRLPATAERWPCAPGPSPAVAICGSEAAMHAARGYWPGVLVIVVSDLPVASTVTISPRHALPYQLQLLCEDMLGQHSFVDNGAMARLKDKVVLAAKSDLNVLITGESGCGKEIIAHDLHAESLRAAEAFVPVNCGAFPAGLIESELFGYGGGAFTGADRKGKMGLFESADRGSIFLDEVGELPLEMQVKLLRVLQDRTIQRVGAGSKPVKLDVRIVAATNRDLRMAVAAGQFRLDLYYRLNVIEIIVPPLRERPEEILALATKFLGDGYTLAPTTASALVAYRWPGNVRELENAMLRARALTHGSTVTLDVLPEEVARGSRRPRISEVLRTALTIAKP